MLEWASAGKHTGLAMLIDHDDADRELRLREPEAVTFADSEKITHIAERLGWVTVSMRDDLATAFATP